MEVNISSGKIEKFNRRPSTISLKKFKASFSTVVCELELKYGANYTEAFAFKQLARHVHYEALDVYEQHFPNPRSSLCHNHRHRLSSYIASYHCTSRNCA
jgi:hypothetical protein